MFLSVKCILLFPELCTLTVIGIQVVKGKTPVCVSCSRHSSILYLFSLVSNLIVALNEISVLHPQKDQVINIINYNLEKS
jgi:hypothetical protein